MAFTGVMPAVDLIAPRYGLEAGATVIKHGDDEQTWGAGFEQENGLCGIKGETWVWCGAIANAKTPPAPVAFAGQTSPDQLTAGEGTSTDRWEQVYPFLVQADDTCADQPGNTLHAKRPDTITHLLDVLEFLSIKGAERELWGGKSNTAAKALTRNANMVGTDLPPKIALAYVEDAMAACLPGVQGTIHLPPAMAALLENSLQEDGGKLTTFSGSQVVVGAGYAGQSPTGKSAIYGTGPVVAHLGPTSMVTDELAQMANVQHNQFTLRAERLVAVTFDGCCHVGATVTLT
jgi:hypothetical protein